MKMTTRTPAALAYRLLLLLLLLLAMLTASFMTKPSLAQRPPPALPSVMVPEGQLVDVYERARPASLRIEGRQGRFDSRPSGVGTGFFISEDGLVLTAAHVIEGSRVFTAVTAEEERYDLKLVGYDAILDLAVLQATTEESVPYLVLTEADPLPGEPIVAIGNSRGDFLAPRAGLVTRLRVDPSSAFFAAGATELTAALGPGDSGGPVLNEQGQAIGVVSYISFAPDLNVPQDEGMLPPDSDTMLASGDFASYVIPVSASSSVLQDLVAGRQRDVPIVGFVSSANYDPEDNRFRGRPFGPLPGAVVTVVSPDSPGARAGLLEPREEPRFNIFGQEIEPRLVVDVIVAVDGQRTHTLDDVVRLIRSKQVGDSIQLTVQRGRESVELELTLAPRGRFYP